MSTKVINQRAHKGNIETKSKILNLYKNMWKAKVSPLIDIATRMFPDNNPIDPSESLVL